MMINSISGSVLRRSLQDLNSMRLKPLPNRLLFLGPTAFLNRRPFGSLAGPGIGARPLTSNRKRLPVSEAAIRSQIHQTLYIHGHLRAKFPLHLAFTVNDFPDIIDLGLGEIIRFGIGIDIQL